jgi:phage shock protein A
MFKRLTLSLKAKFSRLLDRGEDPAEILDYTYERQLEQLHGMRRDVADLVTAKKRIAQLRDRRQDQFVKLQSGARKALELGREDLARQALERKRLVGQELVDLNQQVSELEHQQAQMVARGREARARVERFRSRKEVTKAQYAAAKAHVAISEAVAGISSQLREAGLTIERTMDRVDDMNVRAGAMEELESAGTFAAVGAGEDDIDRQLRELSSGGASIDAEISRLRLELNRGKSSRPPN